MKKIRGLLQGLAVCGLVMAFVATAAAQAPLQGVAKVVRIKGSARYTTGNNVWVPVKLGSVLKPGTVIQTGVEKGAFVDLVLGDGDVAVPGLGGAGTVGGGGGGGGGGENMFYQPNSDQNLVRVTANSILAIDKLTSIETGADTVTETQLDLRAGKIFGNVKKMSAASKYEVKIPNGVAGIRGTIYQISADGVVQVLVGSVVIAFVGPDGTVVTQVVMGGQQFDARTGQITAIPQYIQKELVKEAKAARIGPNTPPTTLTVDHTIYYVSPTVGHNGNNGGNGPPPGDSAVNAVGN